MGTQIAPGVGQKKTTARAALIGLEPAAGKLLQECFREFQIEVVSFSGDKVERQLSQEKFEALVLHLQPETESIMRSVRNSDSNKRMVIYGIADDTRGVMPYAGFGINAIFESKWLQKPMNREAVLKLVRATHLLVANEFRRYIRVPIVTEVSVKTRGQRFTAYSQEISAGGMSMMGAPKLPVGQQLQLSFSLPDSTQVNVNASVCWLRQSDSGLGARFDPLDDRRNVVRDWVEKYLESS